MSKSHSRVATFHLDNAAGSLIDITQYVDQVQQSGSVDMSDVTTLGDNAREYVEGLFSGTLSCGGPFDTVTYTQLAAIVQHGTSKSFQFRPAGSTTGLPQITGECFLGALNFDSSVGNPNKLTFNLTVTGALTYGVVP